MRDAAQRIFNLSAGAVIQTTRDRLHSSGIAQASIAMKPLPSKRHNHPVLSSTFHCLQDVTDASQDDDACKFVIIRPNHVFCHHNSRMLYSLYTRTDPLIAASGSHAPADDGSADCFIAAADDAAGIVSFEVLEAADTGCEFLILLG